MRARPAMQARECGIADVASFEMLACASQLVAVSGPSRSSFNSCPERNDAIDFARKIVEMLGERFRCP